jgi:hypothetical protein
VPGISQDEDGALQDCALILQGIRALHEPLDALERRVAPHGGLAGPQKPGQDGWAGLVPAWKRPTEGEARWSWPAPSTSCGSRPR